MNLNFDTTAVIAAVVGAVCGYLFADRRKAKDHPLVNHVRQMLKDKEKQSKEINVTDELKKLIGG